MTDSIDDFIARVGAVSGDAHAQAALMAEFVVQSRTGSDAQRLALGLNAAAVLRWFDVTSLSVLLDTTLDDAADVFDQLVTLPFVERLGRGSGDRWNVHDLTRLGWRRKLHSDDGNQLSALSARAVKIFETDHTPGGRIEWVYHLLSAEPDRAAKVLGSLIREWYEGVSDADKAILTTTVYELEETGLVDGAARVEVWLLAGELQATDRPAHELESLARRALELSQQRGYETGEARARCLLGDVYDLQGRYAQAAEEFKKYLAIYGRLSERDPSERGWPRGMVSVYERLGDVLDKLGETDEGNRAYAAAQSLAEKLIGEHADVLGVRALLAGVYDIGSLRARRRGDLAEARRLLMKGVAHWEDLHGHASTNVDWTCGFAASLSLIAAIDNEEGRREQARMTQGRSIAVLQQAREENPDNKRVLTDLAYMHLAMRAFLESANMTAEAYEQAKLGLEVRKMLAARQPGSLEAQDQLSNAYYWSGLSAWHSGLHEEAIAALAMATDIARQLTILDSLSASKIEFLVHSLTQLGAFLQLKDRHADARASFAEAVDRSRELVGSVGDPKSKSLLVNSLQQLVRTKFDGKDTRDILPLIDEMVSLQEDFIQRGDLKIESEQALMEMYFWRMSVLQEQGGSAEAFAAAQKVIATYARLVTRDSRDQAWLEGPAKMMMVAAELQARLGDPRRN